MSTSDSGTFHILQAAIVIVGLIAFAAYNCGDAGDDRLKRAVKNEGFTNVVIGTWSPLSCGDGDSISKDFQAQKSQGERIQGTVCCGLLKGCTVRW